MDAQCQVVDSRMDLFIYCVFIVLVGGMLFLSFRDGRVEIMTLRISRVDNPIGYWFGVAGYIFILLTILISPMFG